MAEKQSPGGRSTGLKRKRGDKFYTSPAAVRLVMRELRGYLARRSPPIRAFVEPSAGAGAFLPALRRLAARQRRRREGAACGEGVQVLAYDLDPQAAGVVEQDFLRLDTSGLEGGGTAVVGNPPFGRQSGLARKFIKKCCGFADVVAFVLPRSFKKPSMQRAFARRFHLARSLDLPPDSFLVDGRPHDVPCVFQIWERRGADRPVPERAAPDASRYAYTKDPEHAHAAFRRIGVNAGRFYWGRDLAARSPNSHYFLRFARSRSAWARIAAADAGFEDDNTVGPRSISKQELTRMLNRVLR